MNRRDFFKFLGTAASAAVVATLPKLPNLPTRPQWGAREFINYFRSNAQAVGFLVPQEFDRELLTRLHGQQVMLSKRINIPVYQNWHWYEVKR